MAWLRKRLKISERRRIGAIKLLLIVDRLDLPVKLPVSTCKLCWKQMVLFLIMWRIRLGAPWNLLRFQSSQADKESLHDS